MYVIRLLKPNRFSYRVLSQYEAPFRLCFVYIRRGSSVFVLGRMIKESVRLSSVEALDTFVLSDPSTGLRVTRLGR